jgi:multiple sugar transport system ATP-binding protein
VTEIRLDNVSKHFESLTAVSEVDITINAGEFFVLLGPSGCGKTTTLRMLAGLERPSGGEIYFNDDAVTEQKPAERDISMVFQNYALYPHMTVYKNIAFPLSLSRRNYTDNETDQKVRETADLLDIDDQLDKQPKNLSGGQQQRVALGRALVRDPAVFLMDEPLSNLDAKLRVQMRSELKQLHDTLGVTTVYVTHDQTEAMSLADRICVLNEGKVQQIGTPYEVFDQPQNTWVGGFIGDPPMNFLHGSLKQTESGIYVSSDSYHYRIGDADAQLIEDHDTADMVTLGVRPRDFDVDNNSSEYTIPATVVTVEPTGERSILTVEVGNREIKVETEPQEFADAQGETVHLRPVRTYFYDREGELVSMSESTRQQVTEVRKDGGV